MLAGTWNVNQSRPPRSCLQQWVGVNSGTADVVVVGLQEVEMGTGSVATDLAKNLVNRGALERGNDNAKWVCRQRPFVMILGNECLTTAASDTPLCMLRRA